MSLLLGEGTNDPNAPNQLTTNLSLITNHILAIFLCATGKYWSRDDHTISAIPLDSSDFSSLFLGGFGTGAQKHLVFYGQPPAHVSFIFTQLSSLFKHCAINTLTTPTGPKPSPLQDAKKHRDLHVTCHVESRPLDHKPSSQDLRVACWGSCPFPKPVSGRREEDFWVFLCVFYTIGLQLLLL